MDRLKSQTFNYYIKQMKKAITSAYASIILLFYVKIKMWFNTVVTD